LPFSLRKHDIMSSTQSSSAAVSHAPSHTGFRHRASRLIQTGMEWIVLALVVLSPWAFGAVEPPIEEMVYAVVALLVALWGVRMILEGQAWWRKCPVTLCLAALLFLGVAQLQPLPTAVLARLSPATAETYQQLLPAEPEILLQDEPHEPVQPPAGTTLSLYAAATQSLVFQIFVVLALFAVVRNNTASADSLRRLSVACLVNAALLSLLAIAQYLSSPHHVVYWIFPSPGQVFGPFICRSHFAFYVNICIGLGVGVLLRLPAVFAHAAQPGPTKNGHVRSRKHPHRPALAPAPHEEAPPEPLSMATLLQRPVVLWVCLALALTVAAVVLCLSRGGYLALLGAALVSAALWMAQPRRTFRLGAGLLVLGIALALVIWFGLERVQARLAVTLEQMTVETRWALWSRGFEIGTEYPVFGTGYGTFREVEPTLRESAVDAGLDYQYAHNDYLEAFVEGGLIRLLISLLAIGLVFWLGYRAFRRYRGQPVAALVLGALFGVLTFVLHSVGDFGLHIPAIAVLATVLAAHVCALGSSPSAEAPDQYSLRLGGVAPAVAACTLVLVGLAIYGTGWKYERIHRLREAARRLLIDPDPAGRPDAIEYLERAAKLAPESARLQLQVAQAHFQMFDSATSKLAYRTGIIQGGQTVLLGAHQDLSACAAPSLGRWLLATGAQELQMEDEADKPAREHLFVALRHLMRARDLSPLLLQPQLQIAIHQQDFVKAEARSAYLRRAKMLAPNDPEVWFLLGAQELLDGDPDKAGKSWQHSLELSPKYLDDILAPIVRRDDAEALLAKVLPDRPAILLDAALKLFPPAQADKRRAMLERALTLVNQAPGPSTAADFHLQGRLYEELGDLPLAQKAHEAAVARLPQYPEWRYDLARVMYRRGQLPEARAQLHVVLGQQPAHAGAKQLMKEIDEALQR
jgi:tetratricopeptide (TPR) repeat protein